MACLFTEEAWQRHRLAGLHAYEAMILNHTPTLTGEPWVPDIFETEINRHPIFQKCRWYDLKRLVADGFPINGTLNSNLPAGAIWSVDEPVVWAVLRPCLDMASRIFEASLTLPFWDAILDVQPSTHLWHEKAGLGDNLKDQPYKALDRDPTNRCSSPTELRDQFTTYARHIAFSFMPIPDDLNRKPAGTFFPKVKTFECLSYEMSLTCSGVVS